MPDSDDLLGQNEVDVRNEARNPLNAMPPMMFMSRHPDRVRLQVPACDRCSVGVMDSTNPHLLGTCLCACHENTGHQAEDTSPDREKD